MAKATVVPLRSRWLVLPIIPTLVAVVCAHCRNCDSGIRVDVFHHSALSKPILLILLALDDTEAINPEVLQSEVPRQDNGLLEGLGDLRPIDNNLIGINRLVGSYARWFDLAPAVTEACVLDWWMGIVGEFNKFDPGLWTSKVQESTWAECRILRLTLVMSVSALFEPFQSLPQPLRLERGVVADGERAGRIRFELRYTAYRFQCWQPLGQ